MGIPRVPKLVLSTTARAARVSNKPIVMIQACWRGTDAASFRGPNPAYIFVRTWASPADLSGRDGAAARLS
ncbi:hypothetical protein GCM10020219_026810 [Nonomuraea dietziae]